MDVNDITHAHGVRVVVGVTVTLKIGEKQPEARRRGGLWPTKCIKGEADAPRNVVKASFVG